jgi:methylated-DNA-[protein]-cysteine S-methyltransferase
MPQLSMHSPIGDLTVSEDDGAIVALDWGWGRDQSRTPLLRRAVHQLEQYFDGSLTSFDLPLAPHGTPFQRRVWDEMMRIPLGQVRTYGALAARLKSSARSVGTACGKNPIPVIIPCHRVVAAGGLGGYSGDGGATTKRALLIHEGAAPLPLFAAD